MFLDFLYIIKAVSNAAAALLVSRLLVYNVQLWPSLSFPFRCCILSCTLCFLRLDLTRTLSRQASDWDLSLLFVESVRAFTRRRVYARVFQASPFSRLSSSARATTVSIFVSIFKNTFYNTASAAALQVDNED